MFRGSIDEKVKFINKTINLQPTVDLPSSEIGQSAPNFVVRELRPEPGLVLTPLLLTVVQIVLGMQQRLELAN